MSLEREHGYAPVNGLEMYYEIHGSGQPLVLLHGALSATGTSFGKVLPSLAKSRKVIAVELQAHGRTADVDQGRPERLRGGGERLPRCDLVRDRRPSGPVRP